MSVRCGLAINWTAQVQRLDDLARLQFEIRADQVRNQFGIDLLGSESIHEDADRIGNTDRVSELHFATVGKSGGHDVLCDVTRHVSRRAIDLGRIFSTECSAAMTAHAAVSVDDNLASRQAGIAHRSADDEASGRIDVVLGVLVKKMRGNHRLNDVFQNVCAQFVIADAFRVLCGDDHGIDALHVFLRIVFNRHLRFSIGTQVRAGSILANFRKF